MHVDIHACAIAFDTAFVNIGLISCIKLEEMSNKKCFDSLKYNIFTSFEYFRK